MAKLPSYLAIEGLIGVGKTNLTHRLARRFAYQLVLEEVEENPFLPDFYRDPKHYAFQTQLFFLLSRFRQQTLLMEQDIFYSGVVSDYLFAKDRIFAALNLEERDHYLYQQVAPLVEQQIPHPDMVIYLTASMDVVLERIKKRGRAYERNMSVEYLARLAEAYNHFFFHFTACPLLVVDTSNLNLVDDGSDFDELVARIEHGVTGTMYFSLQKQIF